MIKAGRQVVQRQQTEKPKELDERLTALKLLYNQLGAQVSEQHRLKSHRFNVKRQIVPFK